MRGIASHGALRELCETLRQHAPGQGIAPALFSSVRPQSALERALVVRMAKTLPLLAHSTETGDAAAVVSAMSALVGLGAGLTPAGDDFVVGYLAALWSRCSPRTWHRRAAERTGGASRAVVAMHQRDQPPDVARRASGSFRRAPDRRHALRLWKRRRRLRNPAGAGSRTQFRCGRLVRTAVRLFARADGAADHRPPSQAIFSVIAVQPARQRSPADPGEQRLSATLVKIVPREYRDSVSLMQLSALLGKLPGVEQASAVMATENNLALLAEAGLRVDAKGAQRERSADRGAGREIGVACRHRGGDEEPHAADRRQCR